MPLSLGMVRDEAQSVETFGRGRRPRSIRLRLRHRRRPPGRQALDVAGGLRDAAQEALGAGEAVSRSHSGAMSQTATFTSVPARARGRVWTTVEGSSGPCGRWGRGGR